MYFRRNENKRKNEILSDMIWCCPVGCNRYDRLPWSNSSSLLNNNNCLFIRKQENFQFNLCWKFLFFSISENSLNWEWDGNLTLETCSWPWIHLHEVKNDTVAHWKTCSTTLAANLLRNIIEMQSDHITVFFPAKYWPIQHRPPRPESKWTSTESTANFSSKLWTFFLFLFFGSVGRSMSRWIEYMSAFKFIVSLRPSNKQKKSWSRPPLSSPPPTATKD